MNGSKATSATERPANCACAGIDTVFHAAAIPGIWGPWKLFYETNTLGTLNMLEACMKQRIPKFVYTSSPSVIYDGADHLGIDENHPYPHELSVSLSAHQGARGKGRTGG